MKNDKVKLKGHLKVTRDNNEILKNTVASSKEIIEELKHKNEESDMRANHLEETIEELKTNQAKLVSDLENCARSDVDLVISQRELKECNENLEAETRRNTQCESGRTTCSNTLEHQVKINQNLQEQNTKLLSKLEDEVEEKEYLQEKFESVSQQKCPSGKFYSLMAHKLWGLPQLLELIRKSASHRSSVNLN